MVNTPSEWPCVHAIAEEYFWFDNIPFLCSLKYLNTFLSFKVLDIFCKIRN